MIPPCILLCLWTSSISVSPSKQSSTKSSQWIIKWHFSKRNKGLHHYPEHAEHRPPSVRKWLPPAWSNEKPDPDSSALQRDPATGLLSLRQTLDCFNKSNCNTGPEAEIFYPFITNSAGNPTAHPFNQVELRYVSPDEDFISSYIPMHGWNYTWEDHMRSKLRCGCISLRGIHLRCPQACPGRYPSKKKIKEILCGIPKGPLLWLLHPCLHFPIYHTRQFISACRLSKSLRWVS